MLYGSLRRSPRVRLSPCFSHMLNSCDMLLTLKPAQDEKDTDSSSSDDHERRRRPSQMTTPGSQIVQHEGTGMLVVCASLKLVCVPTEADSLCAVRNSRRLLRRGGRRSCCSPEARRADEQRFCCDGRYVGFDLARSCDEHAGRSCEAERRLERRRVAFKLCAERFIFGLQPSPFGLGYSFERRQ